MKSETIRLFNNFISRNFFGYYERLAVLANDALDLYLKGVISLHEFKLIIAANKN